MRSRSPRRGSYGGPGSSRSLLEPVVERLGRLAAVADRVLLVGGQLRHRATVVVVVGHERRVVAEAAVAARGGRQLSGAAMLEQPLLAVRAHVHESADVGDAAVATGGPNLVEQLLQVLLVGRVLARVARAAYAGAPAQHGGLDPRVVGDRRQ